MLGGGDLQRPRGRLCGFAKSARFGIRGRQCRKNVWIATAGKALSLLCQFHRTAAVSDGRVRTRCQDPGQASPGLCKVGLCFQGLLVVEHRIPRLPLVIENLSQALVGLGIIGTDLERPLVVKGGFPHLALLPEHAGHVVVVLGAVGMDFQRCSQVSEPLIHLPLA